MFPLQLQPVSFHLSQVDTAGGNNALQRYLAHKKPPPPLGPPYGPRDRATVGS